MSTSTSISAVHARRVFDSRGRPTVEAEVTLAGGAVGRAIAPAGASRGSREAVDLRDGGSRLGGYDVGRAVENVKGPIAWSLAGRDALDQATVDALMVEADGTPDKSALGGNAIVAVSLAVAHAAAAAQGLPLWRHLAGQHVVGLPLPEIQIFGGGAHAGRRVDVQDFMVMPVGAWNFADALSMVAEIYRAAGEVMAEAGRLAGVADEGGWWPVFDSNEQALDTLLYAIERAGARPGTDVAISLDIAASELGRDGVYTLGLDRRTLDRDQLAEMYSRWLDRYPIASIEDPVRRGRPRRLGRLHARVRQARADHRRRLPRHVGRARRRRGGGPRLQCGAAEAEPGRHADRDARRDGRGAPRGDGHHRVGAFRRDRGRVDRPPGRRLERRPAQGGQLRPRRADGQVERGAAHRGGAGRRRALRRSVRAGGAVAAGLSRGEAQRATVSAATSSTNPAPASPSVTYAGSVAMRSAKARTLATPTALGKYANIGASLGESPTNT